MNAYISSILFCPSRTSRNRHLKLSILFFFFFLVRWTTGMATCKLSSHLTIDSPLFLGLREFTNVLQNEQINTADLECGSIGSMSPPDSSSTAAFLFFSPELLAFAGLRTKYYYLSTSNRYFVFLSLSPFVYQFFSLNFVVSLNNLYLKSCVEFVDNSSFLEIDSKRDC